jgi:hypothetical protein
MPASRLSVPCSRARPRSLTSTCTRIRQAALAGATAPQLGSTSAPGLGSLLPLCGSTSAPGLGPLLPHSHLDWAGPATSAPGLCPPLPHLHQDWAHPWPHLHQEWAGLGRICTGTGLAPNPHLRGDWPPRLRTAFSLRALRAAATRRGTPLHCVGRRKPAAAREGGKDGPPKRLRCVTRSLRCDGR